MSKRNRKSVDVFKYYDESEDKKIDNQFKDELIDYSDEEVDNEEIQVADLDVNDILKMDVDDLKKSQLIVSKEILTLKNGEERTQAIGDLKEIEAILFARRRYERRKEQMSQELMLKEKEMNDDLELKREQIKQEFELKQKELEQEQEKMAKELALKEKEIEQEADKKEKELVLKEKEIAQNCELQKEQIKEQKKNTFVNAVTNVLLTIVSLGAYNYMLDKQNRFESGENYSTSGSRGLTNNISRIPSVFGKH